MKSTLEYSGKDIQELVRKDLESKGLKPIGEIKINVGYQQKDRPWDSEGPYFDNVSVTVESNNFYV